MSLVIPVNNLYFLDNNVCVCVCVCVCMPVFATVGEEEFSLTLLSSSD